MNYHSVEYFGFSDIGKARSNNEDLLLAAPKYNFFAIADGMGGHKAGEIAAKEAINEIFFHTKKNLDPNKTLLLKDIVYNLKLAINKANYKVFSLGKKNINYRGMGTTFSGLYLNHKTLTYAHVGDSRIYLFRENKLKQLTKDHSLFQELKNNTKIQRKEKKISPYKNIITKAIGTNKLIEPQINHESIKLNDIYLMCTDGLSDFVSSDKILDILKKPISKKTAVNELIESAKKNGSHDNITTLLIEIKDNKLVI